MMLRLKGLVCYHHARKMHQYRATDNVESLLLCSCFFSVPACTAEFQSKHNKLYIDSFSYMCAELFGVNLTEKTMMHAAQVITSVQTCICHYVQRHRMP